MIKLNELFNQLILESTDTSNKIVSAVKDRRLINIYYESPHDAGKDDYPRGWRRIEPFCIGINNYDNTVLRAWELHGPSYSYPDGKPNDPLTHNPGWRMFRVDGITQINETGSERFTAPRPKYNPEDKDMKVIYAAANFGDNTTQSAAPVTVPTPDAQSPSVPTPDAPVTQTTAPTTMGNTFSSDKVNNDPELDNIDSDETDPSVSTEPEQDDAAIDQSNDTVDNNLDKPSWFKSFGDKFKNIVNFGKSDKNKI